MSSPIDPSSLPRWFLLIVLSIVAAGAMTMGYLDASYNALGTTVATMNIVAILFLFGIAMMLVAYAKWL